MAPLAADDSISWSDRTGHNRSQVAVERQSMLQPDADQEGDLTRPASRRSEPGRPGPGRRLAPLDGDVSLADTRPEDAAASGGGARVLLTAEEVADMLGMRVDWIYEQARKGHLPVVKLGRYRRFRREAIEDWIRALET
jgi:excisionase family DNA binding protein